MKHLIIFCQFSLIVFSSTSRWIDSKLGSVDKMKDMSK